MPVLVLRVGRRGLVALLEEARGALGDERERGERGEEDDEDGEEEGGEDAPCPRLLGPVGRA